MARKVRSTATASSAWTIPRIPGSVLRDSQRMNRRRDQFPIQTPRRPLEVDEALLVRHPQREPQKCRAASGSGVFSQSSEPRTTKNTSSRSVASRARFSSSASSCRAQSTWREGGLGNASRLASIFRLGRHRPRNQPETRRIIFRKAAALSPNLECGLHPQSDQKAADLMRLRRLTSTLIVANPRKSTRPRCRHYRPAR